MLCRAVDFLPKVSSNRMSSNRNSSSSPPLDRSTFVNLLFFFSPRYGFALLNFKEHLLIAVGGKSVEDKGEGPFDLNQGKLYL